jgi:predicted DNA-binding transcriptional regulator YafY
MAKAERVLALLEALQAAPSISGPELARRLRIDVRTVRRDIVSLQELGIPVAAERGPGGGYRLLPGYRMPPLMLTAGEATAVAVGLIAARRDGLDAGGALAKIRRVLPDDVWLRVRRAPRIRPRARRCCCWPTRHSAAGASTRATRARTAPSPSAS